MPEILLNHDRAVHPKCQCRRTSQDCLSWTVSSPNSVATLGALTVVVKAWCSFKVAPGGSNLVTFTVQKFPYDMSMCISTAQARTNRASRRPLCRRSPFFLTRPACLLGYVHSGWQAWHCRDILTSATSFLRDRCKTSVFFSCAWQAWHFLDVAATVAGVGGLWDFGNMFSWQAQCLVNLATENLCKGPKSCACHTESSSCPKSNLTTASHAIIDLFIMPSLWIFLVDTLYR